ncbi:Beta-lactamase enzyme family protein [Thermosyntropha lipolytica DSM 11003]|uniref:Beta-lactamase enzyme family protein n=1 Tax=Thermosyntropha lipolytica DSM 11003 TaxID=1123382 RepID=A0A1M5RW61_9FIRM|nr:serine hydrolase [Thermosyntropha lipolytica]SHH30552.1 Beta-lactamase enzyme family protein [Thermosyntropha lipolytica DSM 11003]
MERLKDTCIYRKYYEIYSDKPSNTSTARDLTWFMVKLAQAAAKGDKGAREVITIMKKNPDKRIGRYIDSSYQVAGKTGTVEKMVGDMALIYAGKEPILALTVIVRSRQEQVVNEKEGEDIIAGIAEAVLKR